jgi:quercetin dioxygenase-like cupin family protein
MELNFPILPVTRTSDTSCFKSGINGSPNNTYMKPDTNNALTSLDIEKSKALIIVEIIEYIPDSVVIKTIIKKSTGNISAVSFDTGEKLEEKTSPFDTFIQIIDGKAEIIIDDTSHLLETGQSIIIPAHSRNSIKANDRFKMISTVIKSGYEEVS